MMRYLFVTLCLCALLGCKSRKPAPPPNNLGTIQETPLLEKPPTPTVEPIIQPIVAADKKIDQAISLTKNVPQAAPLQPIYAGVKADHAAAIAAGEVTKRQILDVDRVVAKNDEIQEGNTAKIKAAAQVDAEETRKIIEAQNDQIVKLENAKYSKAANWYLAISIVLLLGGFGSIAAMFTIGFPLGLKVGMLAIPVGAFSMWVSFHIHTIDTWVGWAVIVAIALAGAYMAWHLFRRDPNAPVHKIQVARVPKVIP